ncbi:MAG: fatty acid--CoA ligase family protein [Steroidobacteraceae bacterium]
MWPWRPWLDDPAQASRPAVECGPHGVTYGELAARVAAYRRRLDDRDTARSGVVGLVADFGIESIALLLAMLEAGEVVALAPRDGRQQEYLRTAGCRTSFVVSVDGALAIEPLPIAPVHPLVESLQARGEGGCVIFTSGTSGQPKAALHSATRLVAKYRDTGRPLRTLAFLRFDHIAGLDTLFHTLASGGTLVLVERRDPHSISTALIDGRVEVLPTSPSFLRLFLAAGAHGATYPSLKVVTYGSEAMDPTTLRVLSERFPAVRLVQKYGTTETGAPRTESREPNSLWLRFRDGTGEGTEVDVRDGVLWLRGSGTLLGYLNAATPVDASGWYCTGDLVDRDGDWLRIRGRVSEVINVGGEKVAPGEVENVLLELPYVTGAVVAGEANAMLGSIVTARVAVVPGHGFADDRALSAAIRRHCRARLAGYKVPVKLVLQAGAALTARLKADRSPTAPEPPVDSR